MKIACIMQIYNEMETGHLVEFFKKNNNLFDFVIAYDDGSTDGSWEFLQKNATHVIRSAKNDFKSEVHHKRMMLEVASRLEAEVIVSLDADEILYIGRQTLENLCRAHFQNFDGIRVDFINLWRSSCYKRVDSLFDEYRPVKIWKHMPNKDPFPSALEGLHQQLFPRYVERIKDDFSIRIIHTGFSTEERIVRKFLQYRRLGQRRFNLMRLIDESHLQVERVPAEFLPVDFDNERSAPEKMEIEDYILLSTKCENKYFRPKLSIICLIYKDVRWLKFVYEQVRKYTDLSDNEFFFIANGASSEVKEYLYNNYIPHFIFDHTEEQSKEFYINNVYRAYNHGAQKAQGDFVVFINSDMAFSPNWLEALYDSYDGHNCVASRLVESGRLATGTHGIEKNFGYNFDEYREEDFLLYARHLNENRLVNGGLFMPLLVRRDQFLSVGGYPEGNVLRGSCIFNPQIARPGENLIPGDVILMQKLESKGVRHQTCFSSIVYHFQEGEKRQPESFIQKSSSKPKIAICNDLVRGTMGEKVLWDELLSLPATVGLDFDKVKGRSPAAFQLALAEEFPTVDIIIQNATFIDFLFPNKYSIVFLQDDLRRMNMQSAIQERNLEKSQSVVVNSISTASSYPEVDSKIIPVGVDISLFSPRDKADMRKKWGFSLEEKIGIFVGALDNIKGWNEVKKCIEDNPQIFWIVVSKKNEIFVHKSVRFFSRVSHETLVELLNCSDFFILGSPVETQCLAAVEAALCGLPVVMDHLTGIFLQMTKADLLAVGVIGVPFATAIAQLEQRKFSPREVMLKYQLTNKEMLERWHSYLSNVFLKVEDYNLSLKKNDTKLDKHFYKIEFFIRKKIFRSLIGRDTLWTVAEISVGLRKNMPTPIFKGLRFLWRLMKGKSG